MNRLFAVKPADIYEHPTDLPTDPDEIPLGPVPGWEAYAVDFGSCGSDWSRVVGPFDPVVERYDGEPVIASRRRGCGDDDLFYFGSKFRSGESDRPDPVWHQSGTTLRFIRKQGV
jgi:hypothetical protein